MWGPDSWSVRGMVVFWRLCIRETYLQIVRLGIDSWVQLLKEGVWWNRALFQNQNGLHYGGQATSTLYVADICFDRPTAE